MQLYQPEKKKRKIVYYYYSCYLPAELWEMIGMYLFRVIDRVHAILTSETHQLSIQLRRHHDKYRKNDFKALFLKITTLKLYELHPQTTFLLNELYAAMTENKSAQKKALWLRNLLSACLERIFDIRTGGERGNLIVNSPHRYIIALGVGTLMPNQIRFLPEIGYLAICHVADHLCLNMVRIYEAEDETLKKQPELIEKEKRLYAYLVNICCGLGMNLPHNVNISTKEYMNTDFFCPPAATVPSAYRMGRTWGQKICGTCKAEVD